MPVREAVRRLTSEGALETLPNRRVRVLVITEARFRELLEIRIALETLAVAKATPHISVADLDRMEALNQVFAEEMARGRGRPCAALPHQQRPALHRLRGGAGTGTAGDDRKHVAAGGALTCT